MTKPKSLFFFVLVLSMIGCTPYQMTLTNEERSYPATTADRVQLFFQGEKTPAAKEIGNIVVSPQSEEEGVEILQEKAASMGADAISNVEVKIQTHVILLFFIPIPIHSYYVSGTAIKYTNEINTEVHNENI